MHTAMEVIAAATRSSPECAASARMPRLPVSTPTTIFMVVSPTAASSEPSAAERLSVSSVVSFGDTPPNLTRRPLGSGYSLLIAHAEGGAFPGVWPFPGGRGASVGHASASQASEARLEGGTCLEDRRSQGQPLPIQSVPRSVSSQHCPAQGL